MLLEQICQLQAAGMSKADLDLGDLRAVLEKGSNGQLLGSCPSPSPYHYCKAAYSQACLLCSLTACPLAVCHLQVAFDFF